MIEPDDRQDNPASLIYYCPHGSERSLSGGQLHRGRLTPVELLELQLAIEWTNGSPRLQLQQYQIPIGCQRAIDERDPQCLFGMRLGLLALVSLLFFNIMAQLVAFDGSQLAERRRQARKNPHTAPPALTSISPHIHRNSSAQQHSHLALNLNYSCASNPSSHSGRPYNPLGHQRSMAPHQQPQCRASRLWTSTRETPH